MEWTIVGAREEVLMNTRTADYTDDQGDITG
jgi:hypothetical protein